MIELVGAALVVVAVNAWLLPVVSWLEGRWIRMYTAWAPDEGTVDEETGRPRADTRDIIRGMAESSRSDQIRSGLAEGYLPAEVALHVLGGWLCGLPKDVSMMAGWTRERVVGAWQSRSEEASGKGFIMPSQVSFITHYDWWIETMDTPTRGRVRRGPRGNPYGFFDQYLSMDELELAGKRIYAWEHGGSTFRTWRHGPEGLEVPVLVDIKVVEVRGSRCFQIQVRDFAGEASGRQAPPVLD